MHSILDSYEKSRWYIGHYLRGSDSYYIFFQGILR